LITPYTKNAEILDDPNAADFPPTFTNWYNGHKVPGYVLHSTLCGLSIGDKYDSSKNACRYSGERQHGSDGGRSEPDRRSSWKGDIFPTALERRGQRNGGKQFVGTSPWSAHRSREYTLV
jgi:hypothetical protein